MKSPAALPSKAILPGLAAALLAAVIPSCSPASGPNSSGPSSSRRASSARRVAGERGAGTKKMVARLEALPREIDPEDDIFMNVERAAYLRARLSGPVDRRTFLELQPRLAQELLNSGKPLEAITEFKKLEEFVERNGVDISRAHRSFLRWNMAIAYMRLGEQENCLAHHTTESCLLPIRGSGVHTIQRGSRSAIAVLTDQLKEFPDDLEARWLINIAYMTVGEYPDKVPRAWLIPPSAFRSDAEVKRFTDIAPRLGLDVDDLSGGSIVDDFDGDGYLDVMASASGLRSQLRYFHNNADGTFSDRTREAGLTGLFGGLNILQADYDNDGFLDVIVLRGAWLGKGGHHPNSLLHNNGDGTFDDVTEEAGLLSFQPTQTAVWFDYDNDGFVDLFIGNESKGDEVHPCELYRNNGDGTFTEVAAAAGVAVVGFVKGVASGDFNNDGRPDLYLSLLNAPNILFRNDGPPGPGAPAGRSWIFTDVAAAAGVIEPLRSFPTWFFDYDNDGWPDIFVSGYGITSVADIAADYLGMKSPGERPRLYHNNHDGTFSDVTRAMGLDRVLQSMGANFGDIDNDGWLDFYLGTGDPNLGTIVPNRMFRNAEGRFFQDVTTSAGVGHLQKGHGISFGDIDNDGDQDIYEVMGGALSGDNYRNVLYENPGYGNHFVTLRLEGVRTNRAAIGARIKVVVDTSAGPRSIYRTVGSGGSFGASPLRQEIGLGQARSIESVAITWPVTGVTQVIRGLDMDRFYRVREGEAAAVPLTLKTLRLSSGPSGGSNGRRGGHSGPARGDR